MRHVTEEGLNLIKRFEGFSPTIYICPAGYSTIGYGHVVLAHEQDQLAAGITQSEAAELLRKDVRIAERAVLRLISVPLTDGQFDGKRPMSPPVRSQRDSRFLPFSGVRIQDEPIENLAAAH